MVPFPTLEDICFKMISREFKKVLNKNKLFNRECVQTRMPPMLMNQLLKCFLSEDWLSGNIRLNSIYIFINRSTQQFSLNKNFFNSCRINLVIKWLAKYSENIRTLDLRHNYINSLSKTNFVELLKNSKRLNSIHVKCRLNCAIYQLLFKNYDDLSDDVKNSLSKIVYIDLDNKVEYTEAAKIVQLIPNLQSLGKYKFIKNVLNYLLELKEFKNKKFNLIEFRDSNTTPSDIQFVAECCPKMKYIHLKVPENKTIEILAKFRELTYLCLNKFSLRQLNNYLKTNGPNITKLKLTSADDEVIVQSIIDKTPKCKEITINNSIIIDPNMDL